jgi:3-hydroxyisobutyrate dehydrogenase
MLNPRTLVREESVERAKAGSVVDRHDDSSPVLARKIAAAAGKRGIAALDAPVSGGDLGAKEARLVIMVGGDAAAFARAKPIFELMGKNHQSAGRGRRRAALQDGQPNCGRGGDGLMVRSAGVCEKSRLDVAMVHATISGGAAGSWAMTNLAPRSLADNFAPGFYVKHILKDMRIALEKRPPR